MRNIKKTQKHIIIKLFETSNEYEIVKVKAQEVGGHIYRGTKIRMTNFVSCNERQRKKNKNCQVEHWLLTAIILVTYDAEIRSIKV
jgi:hypothetical protein